ncbi:Inosine triphosphate pyrophosphatase-like protein [Naviculisporaceae sp. PSN 640]
MSFPLQEPAEVNTDYETKTTKTILVASFNPVKIAAALHGFQAMFPETEFNARGISVPSGVPEQPFSDQETLLGAANRASNARAAEPGPGVDFWVGIEGGVCDDPSPCYPFQDQNPILNETRKQDQVRLQSFAWVVVLGNRNSLQNPTSSLDSHQQRESEFIMGKARTSTYYLPEETTRLVRSGMELGHAEDQIWGRSNSKQQNGSVGLLTQDVVTRKGYIEQAVVLALIPFKNPGLGF